MYSNSSQQMIRKGEDHSQGVDQSSLVVANNSKDSRSRKISYCTNHLQSRQRTHQAKNQDLQIQGPRDLQVPDPNQDLQAQIRQVLRGQDPNHQVLLPILPVHLVLPALLPVHQVPFC